jgi:outer membrane scaffolding protein for murein synthesis (MipA/OmpV family)
VRRVQGNDPRDGGNMIGQIAGYALGWLVLSAMLAITWAGYRRNQRLHQRREQERLSAAWARHHGGDPEYQGGMSRRTA